VLAGDPSLELEYFVGAKSYGLYVIADGSWQIWISNNTLEFYLMVLPAPSLYRKFSNLQKYYRFCKKSINLYDEL